jgi:hypothetical protein
MQYEDAVFVANEIVKNGYMTKHISVEAFHEALMENAQATKREGESVAKAYARVAETPEGDLILRAMRVASDGETKASYLDAKKPAVTSPTPVMTGGMDALNNPAAAVGANRALVAEQVNRDNGGGPKGVRSAIEELTRLAEAGRRDGETSAPAFARAYGDHSELARLEREQNRPPTEVRQAEGW